MFFNFKIPDFLSLKSNKMGMSLVEVSMATFLAAGVGFITMEAQDNAREQMKAVNVYQSAAMLRASIFDLINDPNYLVQDIKKGNETNPRVSNCIPENFGTNASFNSSGCLSNGAASQINLRKPSNNAGKFLGGLNGGNIANRRGTTYFNENGDRCSKADSPKCVIAVQAKFQARCALGSCAGRPDILKISVEMKDHRDDNKKLAFDKKPSIYKFHALHDLTFLKESMEADLNATDDKNGRLCKNKTFPIAGRKQGQSVEGFPVGIKEGKIECAYPDPILYVGREGLRGNRGKPGPKGRACNADSRQGGSQRDMRTCCGGENTSSGRLKCF